MYILVLFGKKTAIKKTAIKKTVAKTVKYNIPCYKLWGTVFLANHINPLFYCYYLLLYSSNKNNVCR